MAKPGLENLVDGDPETITILACCKQRAVLNSDNFQFLHLESPLAITDVAKTAMQSPLFRGIRRACRKLMTVPVNTDGA
ncbi:hypothetical protein [Cryobacterium mannosilyticum]|uniref:hypothetical protein n=1 Tax=Cryobacterium mannosilyticum TaxID=1259190 RepID=UPI00141B632E|nr:hypothetical protein [Cryobacterium mannosilyticum]